jgi:hypothetical protein
MVMGNSELEQECMREVAQQASYVYATQIGYSKSFSKAVKEHAPVFWTSHARSLVKATLVKLLEEMETRLQVLKGQGG